ncbi:MAG: rhodoquinone biosynthesis methyltransferase RquA [Candidatus Accumulibacter sp.]|nr:rhodoquinone biosynthesis methyltransferase RquA [Accumulibacter sp.]
MTVGPYYDGVPDYMIDVYDWAYVDPKWAHALDHNWVVRILLFFNDQRLIRAYLNEIREGMRVWQVAHVYGELVARVAKKVGPTGVFHVTDITPVQIEHATCKLAGMEWAKVIRADAASFVVEESYDLICSFLLLHEVPEEKKHEIVDHMLEKLHKGGKAVFVDYHNPAWWQPIRYILKVVNHYLEPFAEAMWKNEIQHYAREAEQFTWRKRTFFGGVYQCVIVEHKQ